MKVDADRMVGAHLPYGFSSIKLVAITAAGAQFGPPGYEVDLLYIACLAALVLGGSGPFSVDGLIARRWRSTSDSGPGRLGGGVVSLALAAGIASGLAGAGGPGTRLDAAVRPRFKAVAFDYLVLFNPDSVVTDAEVIVPGRGRELTNLWRTRQFESSWLRSITGRYVDFSAVTEDALTYAAHAMQVTLTAEQKPRLLNAYLHLSPWPDSANGLRRLRESGVRVFNQPAQELGIGPDSTVANLDELLEFVRDGAPGR